MKFLYTVCLLALSSSMFAQLDSALIAKYYFNGGNANDDHTGGYHGTVTSASLTADRFGNADKAYSFDGVDDYIALGDSAFRMGVSDFAFSFWIAVQDSQYSMVFSKFHAADAGALHYRQYNILMNSATLLGNTGKYLWSYQYAQQSGSCDGALSNELTNNWHHVVVNFDQGNEVSCYVDNVLVYSVAASNCTEDFDVPNYPLVIGNRYALQDMFFRGKIDDVRIYRRLLTASDIDSLYNEPNPTVVPIGVELAAGERAAALWAYPNPTADGVLRLSALAQSAEVYDAAGKMVLRAQAVEQIRLSGMSAGVYYLHLRDELGAVHRQKIVYMP